jgi:hypothetical protein
MNDAARRHIAQRFLLPSSVRRGGITTQHAYGGKHGFRLAELDAELAEMRREGLIGCAQGLWFLRGTTARELLAAKKESADDT